MKLVLAYDGFDYSQAALEETTRLAAEGANEVVVVSVVPPDARGSKSGGHVGLAPHAHEDVARAHKHLRERGIPSEMKIAHGEPATEIIREAEASRADLIVCGTRGRGPVGRMLLGSVSHMLAENAPCAVLIVSEDRAVRVERRAPTA